MREKTPAKQWIYRLALPAVLFMLASCAGTNTAESNNPTAEALSRQVRDSEARIDPAENDSPDGGFNFGVMVMAHGGSAEWNAHVAQAVRPLRERYPVAMALGMADAGSIEDAVQRLESRGVNQVGVVRVFVSGESWFDRTLQILGVEHGAPPRPDQQTIDAERERMMMPMGFWRVESNADFQVNLDGLADAVEMDEVLLARIRKLSKEPANEVVAVLAHGPGDEAENSRWIEKISQRTRLAGEELGLREIKVFTLREDWPEKRAEAEQEIRGYIKQNRAKGLTPIVVPYRLQGFGPYESVLDGLDYRADRLGLLPHENVGHWIDSQAQLMETKALRAWCQRAEAGQARPSDRCGQ